MIEMIPLNKGSFNMYIALFKHSGNEGKPTTHFHVVLMQKK